MFIVLNLSYGQNVGIGTATPAGSAILELSSANQGFLMTRVGLLNTSDVTTVPVPVTGLLVYNTNTAGDVTPGFYYWDGSKWVRLLNTQSDDWTILGNAGTNPTTNFIGTTDAQDFVVRTNNTEVMRVKSAGNVGVGTTAPATNVKFQANGDATYTIAIAGIGVNTGVYGSATATNGSGVYGNSGSAYTFGGTFVGGTARAGVMGIMSGGPAVYMGGSGGSFNGDPVAVFGNTDSANVISIYGYAAGTGGWGVFGRAISTTDGVGVRGENSSATGAGVLAVGTNAQGTGVVAAGNSAIPTRLVGGSGVAAIGTVGVAAWSNSTTGTAVIGAGNNITPAQVYPNGSGGAFTGDTIGVYAYASAASNNTAAVLGVYGGGGIYNGMGVYGYSYSNTSPASGIGVYGYGGWIGVLGADRISNSPTEFGVFANGDMGASGTKPFVIDHPAEPENKFLKHFSIESNEVLNVYRGNVVLDGNGQAIVELPNYFHLINRNFSYTLTPIGEYAPLYVLQEIDENGKFVIAGGKPGQKVSWYVYAERNDPYLQKYPKKREAEVEKPDRMKGKYLHPELFGQPKEKGIFYRYHSKPVAAESVQFPVERERARINALQNKIQRVSFQEIREK